MPEEPDDQWDQAPTGVPAPGDRIWRHPSELGTAGSDSANGFGLDHSLGGGHPIAPRTSTRGALVGAVLAGLLVSVGVIWLAQPLPDGQRRSPLGGVTASIVPQTTTTPVPAARAAQPLARPLVHPASLLTTTAPTSATPSTMTAPTTAAIPTVSVPSTDSSPVGGHDPGGRLGVSIGDADLDGDGAPDGALVMAVDPSGPAASAGLAVGQTITAIGQAPVTSAGDLTTALKATHSGDVVVVKTSTQSHGTASTEVVITLG
ncbi:MAG: PDZ domain-containing protein [Microthrixaceae bacterium]|nr:PDZ domain-containing protein [Microthrixaceae bacterium]